MEFLVEGKKLDQDELGKMIGGECLIYCGSDSGCGKWNSCVGEKYYGCSGGGAYLYPPGPKGPPGPIG